MLNCSSSTLTYTVEVGTCSPSPGNLLTSVDEELREGVIS